MNNIMLDLETMGTGRNAAIIAIGAVYFDSETQILGDTFYRAVDLESSVAAGGTMDAATVKWWMQQGDSARSLFLSRNVQIEEALVDFYNFVKSRNLNDENVYVWGNSSNFDNLILHQAYANAGMEKPWKFYNDRCYRTVKNLNPDIKMSRTGTHHYALDDAICQANHLMLILDALDKNCKDTGKVTEPATFFQRLAKQLNLFWGD